MNDETGRCPVMVIYGPDDVEDADACTLPRGHQGPCDLQRLSVPQDGQQ